MVTPAAGCDRRFALIPGSSLFCRAALFLDGPVLSLASRSPFLATFISRKPRSLLCIAPVNKGELVDGAACLRGRCLLTVPRRTSPHGAHSSRTRISHPPSLKLAGRYPAGDRVVLSRLRISARCAYTSGSQLRPNRMGSLPLASPTLSDAASMMVLAFNVARADVMAIDRESRYRLNPPATPVVKGCWAPREAVEPIADACLRGAISASPSTNPTRSQFHPPCARRRVAAGTWVGSFQ